jgi:acetyltransferase-like isoleucine patch superfamily enzyme
LTLAPGTWIGECFINASGQGIRISTNCEIFDHAYLDSQNGFIHIGAQSGIGPYALIYGEGGLSIGNYCAIAGHTTIIPGNHNFAATDVPIRHQDITARGIIIEDDCWIAANCVILDGVHIEKGCVIGASSVVRGRVPSMSVAVGVPAEVKSRRA